MIINRWQAPLVPTSAQIKLLLANEGLDPVEERFPANYKIAEHKHPFCEIRIIVEGSMLLNVSGNQVLLRPGDRVEIPANTKHSKQNQTSDDLVCVCAYRAI